MSPRAWFVTGTDTGVGKTVATAALAVALGADATSGTAPYVIKPTQTGVTGDEAGDLDEIRRLAGPVAGAEGIRLAAPLAPDTAARLEGVVLPDLLDQARLVVEAARHHVVVVEGAGGVLVRLGNGWDLLDLARAAADQQVDVQFLVVARAGLGTLNHAALTVRAVRQAGLDVAGLVIGSWPEQPDLAESENLHDLPRVTGVPLLGRIPAGSGSLPAEDFVARARSWISLP
ncbi:MAG: dethiobiotin synthase [Propionibacteriales bacterium]|nr:dethiobiotin synthase [Propionibacteriales bacterium]